MDEDTIMSNVNTMQEMILDEERLVTYVSLSKDLCIHVNDSKHLLRKFVEDMKTKQPDITLNVSYIISGLAQDNKARTTVSSEKDINGIRKALKVVFFEHIYSVSKGPPNVDNVALLAANKFDDFPLCAGLIKSSTCAKRSLDEIGSLKSNSQVHVQPEVKTLNIPVKIKAESGKREKPEKSVTKPQESKSEPSIKTEVVSPKKETSSGNSNKTENKKNGFKAQKGIAGFFSKSNSAPSKTIHKETNGEKKEEPPIKKEKESPKKTQNNENEKMDVDEEVPKPKKEAKQFKSEIKKEQVNGKSKNKSTEKLSQLKKNAKVDKKRKRVLHVSDSESDEEKDPFVDESESRDDINISDDEIPPTPTVNTVKITSGIVNPRKRRKIVDKTYTDEEGYILTKKVEVYESCSEGEEDVPKENIKASPVNKVKLEKQETSPKKTASKNSKKKISPPQKGKQATLMNFFKKV